MKSVAIVILLFINFMLINAVFADDTEDKVRDIRNNMTIVDNFDENIDNGLLSFIMYRGNKIITCKALSKCVYGFVTSGVDYKMHGSSWHIEEKINKESPPIINIKNLKCDLKEIALGGWYRRMLNCLYG